jgi:hypothetical protein
MPGRCGLEARAPVHLVTKLRLATHGTRNLVAPARFLCAVITRRMPCNEEEAFKLTPANQVRRILNLQKQASRLVFQLTPAL